MLFETLVVAFDLLILQELYIKQEELIGKKSILILQDIKLLFSNDFLTIISLGYFSRMWQMVKNNIRLV
jgi:hypothetical protein